MKEVKKNIHRLHYITQGQTLEEIRREMDEVLDAGVEWIQLRVKNKLPGLETMALEFAKKCEDGNVVFIVNDDVEMALRIGASGVHLGQSDKPVSEARKILGPKKIIGGTANTIEQCLNLELEGADYIGLGPFAMTGTKKNLSPLLGLLGIQKILPKEIPYGWSVMSVSLPVLAIGGIQLPDITALKAATGVYGIAVSSLIAKADEKKKIIQQIKTTLYG